LRVRECLAIAATHGIHVPAPSILYDIKGALGGAANWQENRLRLNPVLLLENEKLFIHQTVGHEVAHLVARKRFGATIKPHGPEWQNVMGWLGLTPKRCHQYDVASVRPNSVAYLCCCKTHQLSARKHAKMPHARYFCTKCRVYLTLAVAGAPTPTLKAPTAASRRPGVHPPAPQGPRAPLTPAAPGGYVPRAPTPAMLQYAQVLARQKNISLPLQAMQEFDACSDFISRAKGPNAAGRLLPSEAQLAFARTLSLRSDTPVPAYALTDKSALSAWISLQVGAGAR
jgi:SprT protein